MTTRIIQWSSGNVGKGVIRSIARRASLELVGLYVTNPAKAGLDAGEIAGIDPSGVTATADIDAILATEADVVIHASLPSLVYGDDPGADIDNICCLLASGKNVITTLECKIGWNADFALSCTPRLIIIARAPRRIVNQAIARTGHLIASHASDLRRVS